MKKELKVKTLYYRSYEDDFIESKNQLYEVSENYVWEHKNLFYRISSWLMYKMATVIDFIYCKFILKVKVENNEILKEYKNKGYFLFGNHTQPIGDAFIPTYVTNGKRVRVVVSPANLGIPVLGKILPLLGALPIPKTQRGLKDFKHSISKNVEEGNCIVIYPEAHVWEYYTKIRPFSSNSFRFPIENNMPTFCMTTTYQKPDKKGKPNITIYIDGPFFTNKTSSPKEQRENLRKQVYECMEKRSHNSTYEYIHYEEDKSI